MPLMIEENFTARLLEQLRENELDVICVALPVDLNGLCAWSVHDEEFVVLIPPEPHWADTKAIAAKHPRSEERRVGKECVSTGRSRGSPSPKNDKCQIVHRNYIQKQ